MIKRIFAGLLTVVVLLFAFLMLDEDDWDDILDDSSSGGYGSNGYGELIGTSGDPDQTWSIYWYLCGSDLETEYGAASADLEELMSVELPDNVQVVIQTGGAWDWQNDFVDSSMNQRYLYSSRGLELVDEEWATNMGDPQTLADFLHFSYSNYPADRTMVVFWNHGGGSVSGASFDENYDYDALTLTEFRQAFESVFAPDPADPPFDIIGFDTCLMATIDTASAFEGFGQYLVASEELEPGSGWNYSGLLQALSDDPGMDGARLGQHICDSYMVGCGWLSEDEATLSVVDLGRIAPLADAYEAMGAEALQTAVEDPWFLADFSRRAESTENYGGNTRDEGYTNMVDLGHLAENCTDLLPVSTGAVQDALEQCVLYQVRGDYRENASGLSCYYSFNGDLEDLDGYFQQGCSESFKYLYDYACRGELTPQGMEYVNSLGYLEDMVPELPDLVEDGYDDYPLYLDEEGRVVLELEPEIFNMLKGVYFQLAYADPEEDLILMLGQDNDMYADWENGVFRDNFRGVWGSLDGQLVSMEVSYEGDDYTAYAVPILLNGEEYNLRVIYDYNDGEYYILGARRGQDDNGMADKNLIPLQPGDEVTPLLYASSLYGDDGIVQVPMDPLIVTEDTRFREMDLGDGIFMLMFELVDAKNQTAYSQIAQFEVEGEYMEVTILD